MTNAISRFLSEESGADLIEYALLAALVSLAATLSLTNVGTSIGGLYTKMNTKILAIEP
jgi:pilus assembly protein Flp/PilA